MQTYNDFQWQLNKWYEIKNPDENEDLCTDKWFHFYYHPLLAVLFNPIHANIDKPRLFQLEVGGLQKNDNGLDRDWETIYQYISLHSHLDF